MKKIQELNGPESLVAICGRTNVGKSTLFNRLSEKRLALVSKIEGTTRDSNLNTISWNGHEFKLVDTAGLIESSFMPGSKLSKKAKRLDELDKLSQEKTINYLKQAQVLVFLVDISVGISPQERELAKALIRNKELAEKVILAVNKVDSPRLRLGIEKFRALGFDNIFAISAQTGMGTGDLLDEIVAKLRAKTKKEEANKLKVNDEKVLEGPVEEIKISLLGKPNVGKSSLFNSLMGQDLAIVSELAHTTRESHSRKIFYKDKVIKIIDTAGLTRHGHKKESLEKEGMSISHSSLKKSDIALLILDLSKAITHQDSKIIESVLEHRKSLIIVANKWDLVEERDRKTWTNYIYNKFPFVTWAPILFNSTKRKFKAENIFDLILDLAEARKTEISETQLKKFLAKSVKVHLPAKGKGLKPPHIFEIKQKASKPPFFTVRIGSRDNLHFSYLRFLENRLRKQYNFLGTPIHLKVIKNPRIHGLREV